MDRAELAEHLRQHDKEHHVSDTDWHYDNPTWWSMHELREAHKRDHEARQIRHDHNHEERNT